MERGSREWLEFCLRRQQPLKHTIITVDGAAKMEGTIERCLDPDCDGYTREPTVLHYHTTDVRMVD